MILAKTETACLRLFREGLANRDDAAILLTSKAETNVSGTDQTQISLTNLQQLLDFRAVVGFTDDNMGHHSSFQNEPKVKKSENNLISVIYQCRVFSNHS